jgi:hypothetical protein
MLKKTAVGLFIFVVVLGAICLVLDIIDVNEDYILGLPVNILNTVFIAATAIILVILAAKAYHRTGNAGLLTIGWAEMALLAGTLFKGWVSNVDGRILIVSNESLVLLAALAFLTGGILIVTRPSAYKTSQKTIMLFSYIFTLILISSIILFMYQQILPYIIKWGSISITLQDVFQRISSLFLFGSLLLYLRAYHKERTDINFWFLAGIAFWAFGQLFISLGPVEGKLAWTGRFAEYMGNLSFCMIFREIFWRNKNKSRV